MIAETPPGMWPLPGPHPQRPSLMGLFPYQAKSLASLQCGDK